VTATFTRHGVGITASATRTENGQVTEQFVCDTNEPVVLGDVAASLRQVAGVRTVRQRQPDSFQTKRRRRPARP
jgi:hypothetical protein